MNPVDYAAKKWPTFDVYYYGESETAQFPVCSECWPTWQIHLHQSGRDAWYWVNRWDTRGCGPYCKGPGHHTQWRKIVPPEHLNAPHGAAAA
jgi:hypothetical protein